MGISEEKMKIVINNYFKSECNVNTSIREAFEKGFRIGVKKGLAQSKADTPQTERIKTHDYCDICNHKGCGTCIANNLDDYCVPSNYEPTTQTETQNSNLTFEKADNPQTDDKDTNVLNKSQTDLSAEEFVEGMKNLKMEVKQTDCGWK